MTTVNDVLHFIETLAPLEYKMDWDHVGLSCGSPAQVVRKILVALDPFEHVCHEAAEIGADLLKVFAEKCAVIANMDKAPKLEGRNMSMFLSPKPQAPAKKPAKPKQPKPSPEQKPAEAEPVEAESTEAETN